jgi:hypothetical protein
MVQATISLVSATGNSLAKSQDENGKEFKCGDAEGEEAKVDRKNRDGSKLHSVNWSPTS